MHWRQLHARCSRRWRRSSSRTHRCSSRRHGADRKQGPQLKLLASQRLRSSRSLRFTGAVGSGERDPRSLEFLVNALGTCALLSMMVQPPVADREAWALVAARLALLRRMGMPRDAQSFRSHIPGRIAESVPEAGMPVVRPPAFPLADMSASRVRSRRRAVPAATAIAEGAKKSCHREIWCDVESGCPAGASLRGGVDGCSPGARRHGVAARLARRRRDGP